MGRPLQTDSDRHLQESLRHHPAAAGDRTGNGQSVDLAADAGLGMMRASVVGAEAAGCLDFAAVEGCPVLGQAPMQRDSTVPRLAFQSLILAPLQANHAKQ